MGKIMRLPLTASIRKNLVVWLGWAETFLLWCVVLPKCTLAHCNLIQFKLHPRAPRQHSSNVHALQQTTKHANQKLFGHFGALTAYLFE